MRRSGGDRHARGVAATARRLARLHGLSPRDQARAELAGLLHDCAKGLPRTRLQRWLGQCGADQEERRAPGLWHAPLGAWLARREHGIRDREILRAIRLHSTGAPAMTRLQKILFVADYIEPGRPHWPELPALRRLAAQDLQRAFYEVLRHKLLHVLSQRKRLHPRSLAAYHQAQA